MAGGTISPANNNNDPKIMNIIENGSLAVFDQISPKAK